MRQGLVMEPGLGLWSQDYGYGARTNDGTRARVMGLGLMMEPGLRLWG